MVRTLIALALCLISPIASAQESTCEAPPMREPTRAEQERQQRCERRHDHACLEALECRRLARGEHLLSWTRACVEALPRELLDRCRPGWRARLQSRCTDRDDQRCLAWLHRAPDLEVQAMECSRRGDNRCVIRLLAGQPLSAAGLATLISAYRAIGDQAHALRLMRERWREYVRRTPPDPGPRDDGIPIPRIRRDYDPRRPWQ